MTTSKTLGYSLYRNNLAADDGAKFYARVSKKGKVTEKELIDSMIRMNSTVTRQEVGAVLDLLFEAIKDKVQEGYNVHTRIFKTSLSIKGGFEDTDDEFDSDRHKVRIHVRESALLKKFIDKELSLEKSVADERSPRIMSIYDFASDTNSRTITAGNVATIKGKNLYFDTQDERQGVFFTNTDTNEVFRSAEIRSGSNLSATFMVPQEITAGTYNVHVVCGFGTIIRNAALVEQVTAV